MTWQAGARLTVRGDTWLVIRTTAFPDCEALELACESSAIRRTLLVPFDRPVPSRPPRLHLTSPGRWSALASSQVRTQFPFGSLQSCPSSVRLLPYQLEPALAVLRHGASRVLVADDVGLGKTVEAGLIVKEVADGDGLARILILVPASLREQWKQELWRLFALRVTDADASWLRRSSSELPRDVNPWSLPGVYLASTDFIKRAEALSPLEDVRWDLFVLDEAHAATPGSDRRAAVHALACRSARVILLSATPHSGDAAQFTSLCQTGALSDSPPLVCFSRSRADTSLTDQPIRSRILSVRPTDAECLMHRLLEDYTGRLWRASLTRGGGNAALLATMMRKRALSSAGSLAASARRRVRLLAGQPQPAVAVIQMWLPLEGDEEGAVEDDAPDRVLAGGGLGNGEEECGLLERIAGIAERAAAAESKVRVLVRLLRRVREPAIVFSEYRDTADRLSSVLAGCGHRVLLLHGGLSTEARRGAVAAFAAGDAVLVATDAAAEGLNLHAACRLVIHFELPWTPARLHQRCGRVNRIGQTRRVHEIALVADDTSEQLVLVPLVQRAARSGLFTRGAFVQQLSEMRVAAHVIGGSPLAAAEEPLRPPDFVTLTLGDEACAEARRLELLRRLQRLPSPPSLARRAVIPVALTRRRSSRSPGLLTLVLSISVSEGSGHILERAIVSVVCELRVGRWPRRAARLLVQVGAALDRVNSEVSGLAQRTADRRLLAIAPIHAAATALRQQRESAMGRELPSAARQLVQAGLFDRRALAAATARSRAPDVSGERRPTQAAERQQAVLRTQVKLIAVLCGGLE